MSPLRKKSPNRTWTPETRRSGPAPFLPCLGLLLAGLAGAPARAEKTPEPPLPLEETNSYHFQTTTVTQAHPGFNSPYFGPNSLSGSYESRTSLTSTVFAGHRLWSGGAFFFNPELSAFGGLSGTHGMAGFPNGEIYRVDDPTPKLSLSRVFMQQTIGLGQGTENGEAGPNRLAGTTEAAHLLIVAGKFSLNDYFDDNTYSHDPRTQFLNWALMDNGAWDYAADTRGYTWGLMLELHLPRWSFRVAEALVPKSANQLALDARFYVNGSENGEAEYRYRLDDAHPGKMRLLVYENRANMGQYLQAINDPAAGVDITQTRGSGTRTKFGFGLNLEQELTSDLGAFARAGWSNGATETWAFTEIDRALSMGAVLTGARWQRPEDTVGTAVLWNGLSRDHANYLAAGGSGFMLGDGALNYAPEEIIEAYYSVQARKDLAVTGDFQLVTNPGYNRDRGPVEIFSLRLHYEI